MVRPMDPLTEMPASFAAGTTVKLRLSFSDYPASAGWALTLLLAGASVVSATGNASGDAHDVTLTAAATAPLQPGTYRSTARLSKAGEVYDVALGYVSVTRNLATAGPGDALSSAETLLAEVDTAIAAIVAGRLQSYQLPGHGGEKLDLEKLTTLRTKLQAEVRRLQNGGKVGVLHAFQFRPAS